MILNGHYVHVSAADWAVCGPDGVGIFSDTGPHSCRYQHSGGQPWCHCVRLCAGILKEIPANTYCCMCHYRAVFLKEILRRFLRSMYDMISSHMISFNIIWHHIAHAEESRHYIGTVGTCRHSQSCSHLSIRLSLILRLNVLDELYDF